MRRFAAVVMAASCAGALPPPSEVPGVRVPVSSRDWEIRPDGLGALDVQVPVRFREAKRILPDATVRFVEGHPARRIRRGLYVAFDMGEEELFRSYCWCAKGPDGSVVVLDQARRWGSSIEEVPLAPITSNPRFRTERGVGVGSTVGALTRAYQEYGPPYVVGTFSRGEEAPDSEYACFLSDTRNAARPGTVEMIRFYLRPAPGKQAAGRYVESLDGPLAQRDIDPDATVVAVQPHQRCDPLAPGE